MSLVDLANGQESSSLKQYLQDIAPYDKLTPLEEQALAKRVAMGDEGARTLFLNHNLKFVVSIAKRYSANPDKLQELIQEGNLGLMRALEGFDFTKGYKFSTYAHWWIRQAISRYRANHSRLIRLPVYIHTDQKRAFRIFCALYVDLGREPMMVDVADAYTQELCEKAKEDGKPEPESVSVEYVTFLLQIDMAPLSLSAYYDEDEQAQEFYVADPDPTPEELVETGDLPEIVTHAMQRLNKQERKAIELRFGLIDGQDKTLEQASKVMQVTRERVRQVEERAKRKLKPELQKALA